jgi:sugar O-acyltransferase (sialic acid O-acetyltransferase NeuD family)
MKSLAIFGTGGMGREAAHWALESGFEKVTLTVDDEYFSDSYIDGFEVIPFSQMMIEDFMWAIAVADSSLREASVKKLESTAEFATLIHPSARVHKSSHIGHGVIVGPGVSISINVRIGDHSIANVHSVIGHDCEFGEYTTISPGAVISGNCKIGKHVFLGANSSLREKITISDESVVGMGTVVVKDLSKGVYVGNPARKIK